MGTKKGGKKHSDYIGTNIQKGAKLPSGKDQNEKDDNQSDVLKGLIDGQTTQIVNAIISDKGLKGVITNDFISVLNGDDTSYFKTVYKFQKDIQDLLKDRFAAVLAILYGNKTIDPTMPYNTVKGKLGVGDITQTPFNAINKTLISILKTIYKSTGENSKTGDVKGAANKSVDNTKNTKKQKSKDVAITGADIANVDQLINMINNMDSIDKKQAKSLKEVWLCLDEIITSLNNTKINKKALDDILAVVGDNGLNKIVTKIGADIANVDQLINMINNMDSIDKKQAKSLKEVWLCLDEIITSLNNTKINKKALDDILAVVGDNGLNKIVTKIGADIANVDQLINMINNMDSIDKKQAKSLKEVWLCLDEIITSLNNTKINKKALDDILAVVGDNGLNKIVTKINKLPEVEKNKQKTITALNDLMIAITNLLQLDKDIKTAEDKIDIIIHIIGSEKTNDGFYAIIDKFNDLPEINGDVKKKSTVIKNLIVGVVNAANTVSLVDTILGFIKLCHVNILLLLVPYTIKLFNKLKPGSDAKNKEKIKSILNILQGIMSVNKALSLKELITIKPKIKIFNGILVDMYRSVAFFENIEPSTEKESTKKIARVVTIINGIVALNTIINENQIKQLQEKIKIVNDVVGMLPTIWDKIINGQPNKDVDMAIHRIVEVLNIIEDNDVEKMKTFIVFGEQLWKINLSFIIAGLLAKSVTKTIGNLITEFNEMALLMEAFSGIDGRRISVEKAQKLKKMAVALCGMNIALSLVWVTGKMAMKALEQLIGGKNSEIKQLQKIITALGEIDTTQIENSKKMMTIIKTVSLLGLMNVVLMAAAITGPLALLGMYFIKLEISMLKKVCSGLADINTDDIGVNKLKSIAILVAFCSVILIMASFTGKLVMKNFIYIMAFSIALSAFIVMVIGGINLGTKGMDEASANITEFGKLIAICAGVMILGAMFIVGAPWLVVASMGFALALGVFMFTVLMAINLGTHGLDTAFDDLKGFGKLIGISCFVMLLGAIFVNTPGQLTPLLVGDAVVFGVFLGLFMLVTVGAYNLASRGIGSAMKHAGQFSILLVVSTFLMVVGAVFMQVKLGGAVSGSVAEHAKVFGLDLGSMGDYMWVQSLCFGVVLGLFMFVITKAYAMGAKGIGRAMGSAGALLVLTVVSTIILFIGGTIMMTPGMQEAVVAFTVTISIFVGAMAGVIYGLSKMSLKQLGYGVLVINGIAECVIALSVALMFVDAVKVEWGHLMSVLGQMGTTVALVGTVAAALGAIAAIPGVAPLLGAGALVINGVAECIVVMAYALQEVAKVKSTSLTAIEQACDGFNKLLTSDKGGFRPFMSLELALDMKLVKSSISSMCECIEMIGNAVQNIANLTIITFDKNGKETGKRHLKESDFKNAATNTQTIITTLGGTIIDIYNGKTGDKKVDDTAKEMFSSGYILGDLLGADTVFSRVCKSCATLGQMITDIADGVKNYADMRVTTYDKNGKAVGTRKLTKSDFINAATNVQTIITDLGGAVMSIYYGEITLANGKKVEAKEMFDWHLLHDNAFVRVVKSTSELGKMIASIAAGVKDYAEMRINTYDKDGKVIGTRTFTDNDFKNAAKNVQIILTTLGKAVCQTYADNEQTTLKDCDTNDPSSVISKMTLSLSGIGVLMKSAIDAIEAVENMAVEFDDKGVKEKAIKKKVSTVLTVLAGAICDVAKNPDYKGLFDDPNWGVLEEDRTETSGIEANCDRNSVSIHTKTTKHTSVNSPVGRVIQSLSGSETLILGGIDMINRILALGEFTSEQQTKVENITKLSLTCLSGGIYQIADTYKDVFESLGEYDNGSTKNLYTITKNSILNSKDLIDTGLAAIDKLKPYTELCRGYDFVIGGTKMKSMKTSQLGAIEEVARVAVGLLADTIISLAEEHPDVFDDPGWWDRKLGGETKGNSPVRKVINAMTSSKDVVNFGISAIDKISKLNVDPKTIQGNVDNIIGIIPNAIANMTKLNNNIRIPKPDKLKRIGESLNQYYSIISSVCDIYTMTYAKVNNRITKANSNKSDWVNGINDSINTMLSNIVNSVREFNRKKNIQEQLTSFTEMISLYSNCINTLSTALNAISETKDNGKILQNVVRDINTVVSETPDLTGFENETKLVEKYVKTVNSINASKVDRLTGLANALTVMSSKLGSLEGLTDVLANKVAIVLSHLSDELARSANTIKTAEKIQNNRHAKITDAMKQLKKMMDMPLNVSVLHKQDTDYNLPSGGAGGDSPTDQQGYHGGSTTEYTYQSTPAPSTKGVTTSQCRQISAQEANKAIYSWCSRQNKGTKR